MNRYIIIVVIMCCLLTGCSWHSLGEKSTSMTPASIGALAKGKSIYVAVDGAMPEKSDTSPEFVTTQIAKMLSPVAQAVMPASSSETAESALQKAKANSSEYLMLLKVAKWQRASPIRPVTVLMDISVLDVATGQALVSSSLQADCYVMLTGLEGSPRECMRPEFNRWTSTTFGEAVKTRPNTEEMMR